MQDGIWGFRGTGPPHSGDCRSAALSGATRGPAPALWAEQTETEAGWARGLLLQLETTSRLQTICPDSPCYCHTAPTEHHTCEEQPQTQHTAMIPGRACENDLGFPGCNFPDSDRALHSRRWSLTRERETSSHDTSMMRNHTCCMTLNYSQ